MAWSRWSTQVTRACQPVLIVPTLDDEAFTVAVHRRSTKGMPAQLVSRPAPRAAAHADCRAQQVRSVLRGQGSEATPSTSRGRRCWPAY